MKKEKGTNDDHLPPAPQGAGSDASRFVWGDRLLFALVGLVLGFAAAYLYLDRTPQPAAHGPGDGHDHGMEATQSAPGASRDLPGSGGGAPSISMDPAMRQRLAELDAAVAKDPQNYGLLVQLGNASYDMEDWRRAVDAYERALKVKGGDPNVMTDLGVAYRNLGDSDHALHLFQGAQKADPKHWQSRFNEAIVLGLDRKEKAKALEILAQLRKEHPDVAAISSLEEMLKRS